MHASFSIYIYCLLMSTFFSQGSGLGTVNGAENTAGTDICVDCLCLSVLMLEFFTSQ